MKTSLQLSAKGGGVLRTVASALVWMSVTANAQTFITLKSFGNSTNITGIGPHCRLVQGLDGTLYGTTADGDGNLRGTVFKVQPDGSGFTVLKYFTNTVEGERSLA